MTEQYHNNNINQPRYPRFTSTNLQASLDDDLIIADSLLAPITVTLPIANQIPGSIFTVKAPFADSNPVTVAASPGQTIDGAPLVILNSVQQSLTIQSDGVDWAVIGAAGTTTASARLYDAVVDAAGGGDFTLISAAFNSGAQSVFVRAGNYLETADVSIPSGGCLIGECPGNVFVVLSGGFVVQVDGSGRRTTAGSISINPGTSSVAGLGTLFTALNPGDFILIGDAFYQIATITDDFNLNITAIFRGVPIAGQAMVGQSMFFGVEIRNLVITAGTQQGLILNQVQLSSFDNVSIRNNNTTGGNEAFLIENSAYLSFNSFGMVSNGTQGVRAVGGISMAFVSCVFRNNNGAGCTFEDCQSIALSASQAIHNSNAGFRALGQTTHFQIDNCVALQNGGDGIETSSSSQAAILSNCSVSFNGGFGIDFDGSANVVEGCLVNGNQSGGIDAGDDGVIDGCHVIDNTGVGISMQADQDCAITSCVIENNSSHGILVGSDSTISVNRIRDNGGDGIRIPSNADDSVITGNRVSGNGGSGVIVVAAGASRTIVTSNNLTGNIGANFVDNGTGTISANNAV